MEAAASTGGHVHAGDHGRSAFMLAEFTETPYIEVVKISILPAILYFLAVGAMVYLEARKTKLVGLPKNELPKIGDVQRSYQFLPIPVIIVLMLQRYRPFIRPSGPSSPPLSSPGSARKPGWDPRRFSTPSRAAARASLSVGSLVGPSA